MDSENTIWSLIGGKLNEELSEEELPRLEELIQDKQLLARMEVIHSGVKEMKKVRRFDKNSSWDQIVRHVRNTKRRIQTMTVVGIAAALILTFILGTVFDRFRFETELPVQYAEIDVTYGQTNHLVLFDGTEVWLNSGTTFRYPSRFNLDERNVYVEGEAFFNVTSNEKLPFKVHTSQMEVEVLGTSFNVSAYPGDSVQSVVLVEGKVQINDTDGYEIGQLLPGQIAFQRPDQGLRVQEVSTPVYTNWKEGILSFREEKLEDLAKKMERWYNIEISFENEKLKRHAVTGTVLRDKPIDQIIDILEMIAPVRFEYIAMPDKKSKLIITESGEG